MRSAIVENGIVRNIIVGGIDGSIECGDHVDIGWLYAGGAFSAPPERAATKEDLLFYAASKRFGLETGGYSYNGNSVSTDRDSQSKIGNVALAATISGPSFSVDWKCSDGSFFTLNQVDAIAMATEVMTFVSACFSTEEGLVNEINAGTITSRSQIDAAAWPTPA